MLFSKRAEKSRGSRLATTDWPVVGTHVPGLGIYLANPMASWFGKLENWNLPRKHGVVSSIVMVVLKLKVSWALSLCCTTW